MGRYLIPGPTTGLDFVGSEFSASISLDPLNGKGHFFDHPLQEGERIGRRPSRIEADHDDAGALIDSRILVQLGANLTGIHMDPVTRDLFLISFDLLVAFEAY